VLLITACACLAQRSIPSGSGTATAHYYEGNSLGSSCGPWATAGDLFDYNSASPDRFNGYVTAYQMNDYSGWACGKCVKITNSAAGNSIFVTVVDTGGNVFDIKTQKWQELFPGIGLGIQQCSWQEADPCNCPGNPNCGRNPPTNNNNNNNNNNNGGTTRCGTDWTSASNSCGNSCSNNNDCPGGQYCYADLSLCAGNSPPPPPPVVVVQPPQVVNQPPPTASSGNNGGCASGFRCTGTNPEQNPAVNWDNYCNLQQAGRTFCEIGIPGCGCVPAQAIGENTNNFDSTPSDNSNNNLVIGIAIASSFVVVAIVVIVLVVTRKPKLEEKV